MHKPPYIMIVFAAMLGMISMSIFTPALGRELDPVSALGELIFFDRNLSVNGTQSCADCHDPLTGFTGPDSEENRTLAVYQGAIHTRYANRKPPSAAYGGESPVLYYDPDRDNGAENAVGAWIGGMFWDGRAVGDRFGDPLAEQAQGPFLNPLEQAIPNARLVCLKVAHSEYALQFVEVWGEGSLDYARDVDGTYLRIAQSVAAYERSAAVNPYSSKFDLFWSNAIAAGKDVTKITAAGIPGGMGGGGGMGSGGMGGGGMGAGPGGGGMGGPANNPARWEFYRGLGLGDDELKGLAIFNDPNRANCASCHSLAEGSAGYPLFTDFSYHNLGIPKNPDNPYYSMPAKWNPDGADWVDPGLGGFLKNAGYEEDVFGTEMGKFKTPTLRNVDLRPYPEFVKAYGHNGFFKSLDGIEGIIHFYGWRAMMDTNCGGMGCGGMGEGMGGVRMEDLFPPPELDQNRIVMQPFMFNRDGGFLLAFLKTLSDGYFER